MFHADPIVQSHIDILYFERKIAELISACDYYHTEMSINEAIEWGISFGEYIGRYRYGDPIWRFVSKDGKMAFYFIGELEEVKRKIDKVF